MKLHAGCDRYRLAVDDGAGVEPQIDVVKTGHHACEIAVVDRPKVRVEPTVLSRIAAVQIQASDSRAADDLLRQFARTEHHDEGGRSALQVCEHLGVVDIRGT